MLAPLKATLFRVPLEPFEELPFELALYYACEDPLSTALLAKRYLEEFGSYWIDALRDDVERTVEEERERSPKDAETLYSAIEIALKEVERIPTLAFIELLDLGSLAYLPEVVGPRKVKKASIGASLGLHVEKAHKRALGEAKRCLAAMMGAVLGE